MIIHVHIVQQTPVIGNMIVVNINVEWSHTSLTRRVTSPCIRDPYCIKNVFTLTSWTNDGNAVLRHEFHIKWEWVWKIQVLVNRIQFVCELV